MRFEDCGNRETVRPPPDSSSRAHSRHPRGSCSIQASEEILVAVAEAICRFGGPQGVPTSMCSQSDPWFRGAARGSSDMRERGLVKYVTAEASARWHA